MDAYSRVTISEWTFYYVTIRYKYDVDVFSPKHYNRIIISKFYKKKNIFNLNSNIPFFVRFKHFLLAYA